VVRADDPRDWGPGWKPGERRGGDPAVALNVLRLDQGSKAWVSTDLARSADHCGPGKARRTARTTESESAKGEGRDSTSEVSFNRKFTEIIR
jgi:hypothetical protein